MGHSKAVSKGVSTSKAWVRLPITQIIESGKADIEIEEAQEGMVEIAVVVVEMMKVEGKENCLKMSS